MARDRSAVVLGASGSVGEALIEALILHDAIATVVTLVRRSQPAYAALAAERGVTLREVIVAAMEPAALEAATHDAVMALDGAVVGLSVLGVGANTAALTIDQHRAVDVALNEAFAKGLARSGRVAHLAFMSASGADATASTTGSGAAGMARYNRVKGEAEEAVKASGVAVVSVLRPAMIIGSKHTPRWLEKTLPVFSFLTPAKFRSITVQQIANAMVALSVAPPPGSSVLHYPEMMTLQRARNA